VIDPGHGGEDFGARGVGGLLEKDVALAISLKVKKILDASGKVSVLLTRSRDEFVPLAQRMQWANEQNAHRFISIHANASPRATLSGIETYYLDNAADKASTTLADRENGSPESGGDNADLRFMLSDLIQNAKLPESISLAQLLQRNTVRAVRGAGFTLVDRGVKSGPFYVLVGAHMPCALIETAFIDHAEEGGHLGDPTYREAFARGIAAAILESL
jgi:N-acetylmuramoyl-L-alanine amidase